MSEEGALPGAELELQNVWNDLNYWNGWNSDDLINRRFANGWIRL